MQRLINLTDRHALLGFSGGWSTSSRSRSFKYPPGSAAAGTVKRLSPSLFRVDCTSSADLSSQLISRGTGRWLTKFLPCDLMFGQFSGRAARQLVSCSASAQRSLRRGTEYLPLCYRMNSFCSCWPDSAVTDSCWFARQSLKLETQHWLYYYHLKAPS